MAQNHHRNESGKGNRSVKASNKPTRTVIAAVNKNCRSFISLITPNDSGAEIIKSSMGFCVLSTKIRFGRRLGDSNADKRRRNGNLQEGEKMLDIVRYMRCHGIFFC